MTNGKKFSSSILLQMSLINQSQCKRLRDKIISSYVNELRQTTFYQVYFKSVLDNFLKELGERKIEQLVCFGLGSFQNGIDIAPRYQLALLILLYEHLQGLYYPFSNVIEVFDPSFEEIDEGTLLTFTKPSFKLIKENEYCARRIKSSRENTCNLFYMPHLDKYLYNNLLGINWNIENLDKLVILGNSFHEMIDNEPRSECKSDLYYINQLVCNFRSNNNSPQKKEKMRHSNKTQDSIEALVEFPIDDSSFQHYDIFNSLALHSISRKWLLENRSKIESNRLHNWTATTTFLNEGFND